MKEFLALIVVVVITGVIYWGVEPFAHGQMYPKVSPEDYTYADLKPLEAQGGNAVECKEIVTSNW